MRTAQARRSTWLRRTRAITGWVAVSATVATLLIAAVAGSASPPKRVATVLSVPPHMLHPRRAVVVRKHVPVVKPHRVAATAPAPTPTPTPPPAPTPAPPAAPVVVSGGS